MNKNTTIIISIIVLLVLVAGGFVIWAMMNKAPAPLQNSQTQSPTTTTTQNNPPQAGAPVVVTDAITAPYISTVVVKGTVNPNGASTIYWYEYGQTSALGAQTQGYSIGSGYAKIYAPAYITGLVSNTTYNFRLVAKNSFGTVIGSTYSFKTTTTPPPSGVAPTTTTTSATDISRTTANLHGKTNPNGFETAYWFEYGVSSDMGFATASQGAGSANFLQSVSVSLSDLQPATKYFFRLNAQNQFGTVNGQILNFTTMGPVSPAKPTVDTNSATAITDASAKLNASINPNGLATTYWFEYSTNSLLSSILVSTTPQQTLAEGNSSVNVSANFDNLQSDTKYYIRAVAKNSSGTTTGDMVTFTTKK